MIQFGIFGPKRLGWKKNKKYFYSFFKQFCFFFLKEIFVVLSLLVVESLSLSAFPAMTSRRHEDWRGGRGRHQLHREVLRIRENDETRRVVVFRWSHLDAGDQPGRVLGQVRGLPTQLFCQNGLPLLGAIKYCQLNGVDLKKEAALNPRCPISNLNIDSQY